MSQVIMSRGMAGCVGPGTVHLQRFGFLVHSWIGIRSAKRLFLQCRISCGTRNEIGYILIPGFPYMQTRCLDSWKTPGDVVKFGHLCPLSRANYHNPIARMEERRGIHLTLISDDKLAFAFRLLWAIRRKTNDRQLRRDNCDHLVSCCCLDDATTYLNLSRWGFIGKQTPASKVKILPKPRSSFWGKTSFAQPQVISTLIIASKRWIMVFLSIVITLQHQPRRKGPGNGHKNIILPRSAYPDPLKVAPCYDQ